MATPMQECPSFNDCSAPKCPLDSDIDERSPRLPGEDKCKAHKPTRQRIARKYSELLPYKGLTKKEYTGRQIWDRKSPEEKKIIAEQGAKRLKSLNSSKNRGVSNGK